MPMVQTPGGLVKMGKKAARTYQATQQQADLNRQAQAQSMVNQVGPSGETVSFTPTPGAKPGEPGYYTATTTLSPEQKALQDKQNALSGQYGDIASAQLAGISGDMGTPFSLNQFDPQKGREQEIYNMQAAFLDDRFAKEQQNQEAWLEDRGIKFGTPAYETAMQQFNDQRNRAYRDLAIGADQQAFQQSMQGRQQYVTEAEKLRNQKINEANAFRTGGQIQPGPQPQFVNAPGVNAPDYMGLYGQQVASNQASQAAKTGALYGAIGTGVGTATTAAMMSDERLKEDVRRVGHLDDGTKVYTYRYKGSPLMQMGVMAQEIEGRHPEAVADTGDGYKGVYYGKIAKAMRSKNV